MLSGAAVAVVDWPAAAKPKPSDGLGPPKLNPDDERGAAGAGC